MVQPSIEALYTKADALAMTFQRQVRWAFYLIFLLAGIGATLYGIYLTIATGERTAAGKTAVVLPALHRGILWRISLRATPGCAQSLRRISGVGPKGLRVQHYWHALGVTRPTAACYLIRQPLDYQWIRLALWFVTASNPVVAAVTGFERNFADQHP